MRAREPGFTPGSPAGSNVATWYPRSDCMYLLSESVVALTSIHKPGRDCVILCRLPVSMAMTRLISSKRLAKIIASDLFCCEPL
jgi:hypothetical protein